MNILDLILIFIIAATVAAGYSRGFVLSLVSLVRYAVGMPVAFFVADRYNMIIYSRFVRDEAVSRVSQALQSSADIDGFAASVRETVDSLPFGMSGIVDLSFLDNVSSANITESVASNIVEPVACVIIKIVLFILTLLAFSLLAWLISKLIKRLDKIKNIPFKKTNKFLGAVFGVIKSVLVIAVLCAVLVFVKDYIFASSQNEFVNQVNSSAIVEFVNKINPLADLL